MVIVKISKCKVKLNNIKWKAIIVHSTSGLCRFHLTKVLVIYFMVSLPYMDSFLFLC